MNVNLYSLQVDLLFSSQIDIISAVLGKKGLLSGSEVRSVLTTLYLVFFHNGARLLCAVEPRVLGSKHAKCTSKGELFVCWLVSV